jgi:hypothetical protein
MSRRYASLNTAGKLLVGPPEGYGRKKELQVKHWLHQVPPQLPDPEEPPIKPEVRAEAAVSSNKYLSVTSALTSSCRCCYLFANLQTCC